MCILYALEIIFFYSFRVGLRTKTFYFFFYFFNDNNFVKAYRCDNDRNRACSAPSCSILRVRRTSVSKTRGGGFRLEFRRPKPSPGLVHSKPAGIPYPFTRSSGTHRYVRLKNTRNANR